MSFNNYRNLLYFLDRNLRLNMNFLFFFFNWKRSSLNYSFIVVGSLSYFNLFYLFSFYFCTFAGLCFTFYIFFNSWGNWTYLFIKNCSCLYFCRIGCFDIMI